MRLRRLTDFLLVPALLASSATAAETQAWDLADYDSFAAGELDGVVVSRDGVLQLGPRVEPLAEIPADAVWSLATDRERIYAATGHSGAVYRVDGKRVREYWKATEPEVFCLAVGPDGALYAGTSPNGKVYRIESRGNAREYFDPDEEYIWALAFAGDALLVGTGSEGKIYRVSGPGTGEEWTATGQRHVMSLLVRADGSALAGTDPNGVIFRVSSEGDAFALFDGELAEVRSLARVGGREFALLVGDTVTASLQAIAAAQQQAAAQAAASTGAGVTITAQANPQPVVTYAGGKKAALVEIAGDDAFSVWSSNADTVFGMLPLDGETPRLRVASATAGRVYDLKPDGDATLVAETRQKQVTAIAALGATTVIGTSNSGQLSRLPTNAAQAGTLTTPVYDAGRAAQWGEFRWSGDLGGGQVFLQTRSGNTSQPTAMWSDWSEWREASNGTAAVSSPSARYLQWRIRLEAGESGSPRVRGARLRYLPRNGPPRVFSVSVSEHSPEPEAASSGATAGSSGAAFSITVTDSPSGGGATNVSTGNTTETVSAEKAKKLKVSWSAGDEDGDELEAQVSFRGEGESEWKRVRREPEDDHVLLDNDSLADGRYRFRVVVSDAPANPPNRVRTAEKISEPVLLDRTPPLVRAIGEATRTRIEFEAEDAASDLRAAAYSVDAGEWRPVLAEDGIVDARRERFVVSPQGLSSGEHVVTLRVRDEAGNVGLAKAVVR